MQYRSIKMDKDSKMYNLIVSQLVKILNWSFPYFDVTNRNRLKQHMKQHCAGPSVLKGCSQQEQDEATAMCNKYMGDLLPSPLRAWLDHCGLSIGWQADRFQVDLSFCHSMFISISVLFQVQINWQQRVLTLPHCFVAQIVDTDVSCNQLRRTSNRQGQTSKLPKSLPGLRLWCMQWSLDSSWGWVWWLWITIEADNLRDCVSCVDVFVPHKTVRSLYS